MAAIKIIKGGLAIGVAHPLSETEESKRDTIPAISLHASFPFNESASPRSSVPNLPIMTAGANTASGETTEVQNMYYNLIRKNG